MKGRKLLWISVFLAGLSSRLIAQDGGISGDPPLDGSSMLLVVNHQGYTGEDPDILHVIEYTEEAAERTLAGLSIRRKNRVVEDSVAGGIPQGRIKELCLQAGVRWGLAVYTDFREGGRFSWRISVYDAEEGFSRAADTFSIYLLAGIPSANPIDASAERIVQNWQKSYPVQDFDGKFAVTLSQRFRSRQEGVEVRFGSEDGISVGTIE
ncbi:MAG: hypothetical protein LBT39_08850, partial [Treponema sp.]|nr:hypothetical protein [Treponema sp.]